MTTADEIKIESDERGFELHVTTDEGDRYIFNIHSIAEELYDTVKRSIGPWLDEMYAAKATYRPASEDDDPWPGESGFDYYRRTGNAEPLYESADRARKAAKEA